MCGWLALLALIVGVEGSPSATVTAAIEQGATDDIYRAELVSLDTGGSAQLSLSLPWLLGVVPTGSDRAWSLTPTLGFGGSWASKRLRGLTLGLSPQVEFGGPGDTTGNVEVGVPVSVNQAIGMFSLGAELGHTFAPGGGEWGATGSLTTAVTDALQVGAVVAVLADGTSPARVFTNLQTTWTASNAVSLLLVAGVGPVGQPSALQVIGLLGMQVSI